MSDQAEARALPADIVAERATLGSILIDRDAILAVAAWLSPDHFYLAKHAWIYAAALACYERKIPPDISTVSDELRRTGRLEDVGGILYLGELSADVPTAMHIEYYARTVQRTAAHRKIIETGGVIAALGYDEQSDLADLLDLIKEKVTLLNDRHTHPQGISAAELVKLNLPPTKWYIPGLLSQGFGYVAAKPGTGKTWLLLQWAVALACGGKVLGTVDVEPCRVLFLALEDTRASLKERLKMVCHDLPPDDLICFTEDDDWKTLDNGGMHQLEAAIRAYQPGVVIIDTLTAIAPDPPRGSNPYRGEYQSYKPIRALADAYKIAIIGSWHFNKAGYADVLEMVNGSMGLPAVSVNRIGLVRDPDETEARLKSNSKRGAEADWTLNFDMVTCQWVKVGDTQKYRLNKERQAVVDVLAESDVPMSVAEIAKALEMPYNSVVQLLKRMRDAALLESPSRGKYRLIEGVGDDAGESYDHFNHHDSLGQGGCHEMQPTGTPDSAIHDFMTPDSALPGHGKTPNRSHEGDHEGDMAHWDGPDVHDTPGVMNGHKSHEREKNGYDSAPGSHEWLKNGDESPQRSHEGDHERWIDHEHDDRGSRGHPEHLLEDTAEDRVLRQVEQALTEAREILDDPRLCKEEARWCAQRLPESHRASTLQRIEQMIAEQRKARNP